MVIGNERTYMAWAKRRTCESWDKCWIEVNEESKVLLTQRSRLSMLSSLRSIWESPAMVTGSLHWV